MFSLVIVVRNGCPSFVGQLNKFAVVKNQEMLAALNTFDGHTWLDADNSSPDRLDALALRIASGDGLAVAPSVGALGQALADLLDLPDVGFPLVGVSGDGEDSGIGGGGIQDEADRLALGVPAGQVSAYSLTCRRGYGETCRGVERPDEHPAGHGQRARRAFTPATFKTEKRG